MSTSSQSISYWIAQLKDGDQDAVQQLWDRYAEKLVLVAQQHLRNVPKRFADEEDIASSVFHSLCRGAAAGRFQNIKDRDDLWWLLLAITKQKSVDLMRRETALKRGRGQTQTEADLAVIDAEFGRFSLDQIICDEPTPDFIVMLNEQFEHLLSLLRDDTLRSIAVMRIEGYSMQEVADCLGTALRTIERKTQLIRTRWQQEV
jgi:DNA-directed RNA polymerase specialized sigma24 family protein